MNDTAEYDWSQEPEMALLQVAQGVRVEVALVNETEDAERLEFDIVDDSVADFGRGFLGIGTPMARALMGCRAGDTVPYRVADMVEVHVLRVTTSLRTPDASVAAERRAVVEGAVSRSNRDDAVRHALTFSSKWGDYDPEGIESGWDEGD